MLTAALVMMQPGPAVQTDLLVQQGLKSTAFGVPIVRGTWFQYYEPDWSKGYYSSQYQFQDIKKTTSGFDMSFESADKRVFGSQLVRQADSQVEHALTFGWRGDRKVNVEATVAMLWAPVFASESITGDGQTVTLAKTGSSAPGMEGRVLFQSAKSFIFRSKVGEIRVESDTPLQLFDARGYNQGWAKTAPLLWLGVGDLGIEPKTSRTINVKWTFPKSGPSLAAPISTPVKLPENAVSAVANDPNPPLVPKPKRSQLNFDNLTPVGGAWTFPGGVFKYSSFLTQAMDRRFSDWRKVPGKTEVDGGIADMGLRPGGYTISVSPGRVSILGEDEEGLRTAVERFPRLGVRRDGKLMLPVGTMVDEPKRDFRGVHLFVGPEARTFQNKLWTRVLRPLGFNRVVLQCERADWAAIPGTATQETMKKSDLAALFQMYRGMEVEPIPMIQSFGHMEWFFANGQNLGLAFNSQVPYAIDPRKEEANAKLEQVWDEAVSLLNPKFLHFGLDEVDMRGFPEDPKLITELWQIQLARLDKIAKKHRKPMMLWGDKALAPNEAIDAAHGTNDEEAAKRRAAIPKGAYITDWHYRADNDPEKFRKSLNVWLKSGHRPIASMWYQPENIRGFTLAAKGLGTLQTTWAGYASNEANMLRELKQFTAMVLAADYSWSDRGETPKELPYAPENIFRELYFEAPKPILPRKLSSLSNLSASTGSVLEGTTPAPVVIPGSTRPVSEIILGLTNSFAAGEGEIVAQVEVKFVDGTVKSTPVRYGLEVRATDDSKPVGAAERKNGLALVRVSVGGKKVSQIRLVPTSPYAGTKLGSISVEWSGT